MYLSNLNNIEKKAFLGLVVEMAMADGDYSEEEHAIVYAYCQEMKIEFEKEYEKKSVEEILSVVKSNSSGITKKIFIFELLGVALTDGTYDEREKELVLRLCREFEIDVDFVIQCENVIKEYMSFQERINQIVLG